MATSASINTTAPTITGLAAGVKVQRKAMITVAEWGGSWSDGTYTGGTREILGVRTEDSSIELNPDTSTTTDILGVTYTDVNKTEPQQNFDPFYLVGGSAFGAFLTDAVLKNKITAYTNCINVYVIAAFLNEGGSASTYFTVRHRDCSVIPTSIGGDSFVSLPIEVHYSNNITEGTVDKLSSDFTFTAASA